MATNQHQTALFLCTGNYYRSRFAELLFNCLTEKESRTWKAESRGLALERGIHNVGPIAGSVLDYLKFLRLPCPEAHRFPLSATESDFRNADLIVALKEVEHRPLLEERFPGWEERVCYWHIHDVDLATPAEALALIHEEVSRLVEGL